MRRILGPVVLALAACVALPTAPGSAACAAPALRLQGHDYVRMTLTGAMAHGASVSGGVQPGCDDFVEVGPDGKRINSTPPDTPVALERLRGVPLAVAVAPRGARAGAWVASGFLTLLASHPLHHALGVSAPRATRCARALTHVGGRADGAPAPGQGVTLRGGRTLALSATTRTSGRTRAGLPYVDAGDRVDARGAVCTVAGKRSFVARTLAITAG